MRAITLLVVALAANSVAADVSAPTIHWYGEEAGLAAARKLHRPVWLYFTADWCMPCKEMERVTFTDKRVAHELERFVSIRIDCTDSDSPPAAAALKRWNVLAMPTVVILDAAGKELRRISQYLSADELVPILTKIR
jgi:thiol:disulfide interchange protein DsbD